jgi:hypothetical protein
LYDKVNTLNLQFDGISAADAAALVAAIAATRQTNAKGGLLRREGDRAGAHVPLRGFCDGAAHGDDEIERRASAKVEAARIAGVS